MIILGNRVPYEYFITTGKGESAAGSEGLPYETGSYDAALNDAGIQNTNVIEYTSVMPTEAKEISKEEGLKRIQWGEVMECIKAQSNGKKGSKVSAAVMITTITDPKGKYLGGFACEYSGSGIRKAAEVSLLQSIAGMIKRRGYGSIKGELQIYKDNKTETGFIIHPGKIFVYEHMDVVEEHGTVFAVICFVSYKFPTLMKTKTKTRAPHKTSTRKNKKNSMM